MAKTIGNITSKEYAVLRAYSLGMGEDEICKLIPFSRSQLMTLKETLFKKLGVHNVYSLIQTAKGIGVLDPLNFIDESIKTKTLEFIEKHMTALKSENKITPTMRWRWYRIFLSYVAYLEKSDPKKNPTEAG